MGDSRSVQEAKHDSHGLEVPPCRPPLERVGDDRPDVDPGPVLVAPSQSSRDRRSRIIAAEAGEVRAQGSHDAATPLDVEGLRELAGAVALLTSTIMFANACVVDGQIDPCVRL